MKKECKPTAPPGFIFFTNHSGLFQTDKVFENMTCESIRQETATKYSIALDDVLVLEDVTPCSRFSVFLNIKYSQWVESFHKSILIMLEAFKEQLNIRN